MSVQRFCSSCAGPRPIAAKRCPWCLRSYSAPREDPEHMFGIFDGEKNGILDGTNRQPYRE